MEPSKGCREKGVLHLLGKGWMLGLLAGSCSYCDPSSVARPSWMEVMAMGQMGSVPVVTGAGWHPALIPGPVDSGKRVNSAGTRENRRLAYDYSLIPVAEPLFSQCNNLD